MKNKNYPILTYKILNIFFNLTKKLKIKYTILQVYTGKELHPFFLTLFLFKGVFAEKYQQVRGTFYQKRL